MARGRARGVTGPVARLASGAALTLMAIKPGLTVTVIFANSLRCVPSAGPRGLPHSPP